MENLDDLNFFIDGNYCICCKEHIPPKYKIIHPKMDFHRRKHYKKIHKYLSFSSHLATTSHK